MQHIEIKDIDHINEAARCFIEQIGNDKVFAFYGNMGAGKTTFIKAVCQELGVTDVINSPTFAIVNEYEAGNGDTIYHFDCYRINKIVEAIDMGCTDYFDSGNLCLIEWPENIDSLLPDDTVSVHITVNDDESRSIAITR
ncbi:MAG: tRNA (adenosine(37)-N6)-threonylcarbamoyltransferase complex ATPase subunit type 1 TsaE [Bacteroidaceae bacterium]|nr:tRNA (adenosine(37)-N6)-threonylcarbamoyltransferase complex ATPase subunit type 1 TsaE [Bacteroidaceae bacterium]